MILSCIAIQIQMFVHIYQVFLSPCFVSSFQELIPKEAQSSTLICLVSCSFPLSHSRNASPLGPEPLSCHRMPPTHLYFSDHD